jgi:parallel beta-helix repeat protein
MFLKTVSNICFTIDYHGIAFYSLLLLILFVSSFSLYSLSLHFSIYAQIGREPSSFLNNNDCIKYDSGQNIISITCSSANLTDINNKIRNPDILKKAEVSSTRSDWLLNAAIVIKKDAMLYVNSTDTSWLKIVAPDRRGGEEDSLAKANGIEVFGSLKIDSVKISSWDLLANNYAEHEGKRILEGTEYEVYLGSPRPFISVEGEATGTTDITNSEVAYLGYEEGVGGGPVVGLTYFGGDGSIIRNNNIHHLYFAFYSNGVGNITIENNRIHHNGQYGIDPHTGSHDIIIRNNIIYDNVGQGIICSVDCFNITIEGNKVYENEGAGIMFSRNMHDSIARNNTVFDETECIFISDSHRNQIYNNTVTRCSIGGLYLKAGSTDNILYKNIIMDSEKGIVVSNGSSNNKFYNNTIVSDSTQLAISSDGDDNYGKISDRKSNYNLNNNTFVGNKQVIGPEVTIKYPAFGQKVSPDNLTVYGTSLHNDTISCQVAVLLNDEEPYQNAVATGPKDNDDYSKWTFTFDSYYSVIREGVNEITSKITCQSEWNKKGINPTSYDKIIVIATSPEKRDNNYNLTKSRP